MDNQLAPGEEIAGYRVESFLAEGGMAVVYRARHIRLDRRVALKLLAPQLSQTESFRRRFMRESQLAASIDHPNIIPIFEASKIGDVLYIAMRYVDGPDLGELLEREGPLSLERAIGLFQQAASALDEAHEHGLVHRDVKPGNVLVVPGGRADGTDHVYLTDFGLTKRSDSLTGLTTTGQFLGTLPYVAPEQISGGHVDGRADVYALGCVLFRALAGEVPFDRDSNVAIMYAHLSQPPPALTSLRPDLPPAIDGVLQRAMAKRPEDRYASCCDFITDLRAAADGGPPAGVNEPSSRPSAAPALVPRPRQPRAADGVRTGRRIRRVTAAVVLLSVALAGGALAAWRSGTSAHRSSAPVALPFALETYPGGLTVARTWTLTGQRGDHLHGELRVDAPNGTLATLYEVLPTEMTRSLATVNGPDPRSSTKSALGYDLRGRTARFFTLRYDVPVPSAARSLDRLRRWAQDWAGEDVTYRRTLTAAQRPRRAASLQFESPVLTLTAAGRPGRLSVIGSFADGATYNVSSAKYVVIDEPGVATVADNGQVTPRSDGIAHVIAVLGPLSTDVASIRVS